MCISIECEVMEGVTGLRCMEGEMRLCVCVCVGRNWWFRERPGKWE